MNWPPTTPTTRPAAAATPSQAGATRGKPGARCAGSGCGRKRNDASRLVDLFEPPKNLCLLSGQPLGGKCRVGGFEASARTSSSQRPRSTRPRRASVAPIEVHWPVAGHDDGDERLLREMPLTKHDVNERHGCSSRPAKPSMRLACRAARAAVESPGTNARERSIRSAPSWR